MSKYAPSKGDWICGDPKCENINFSKREKCNRCGSRKSNGRLVDARTEIGKDAAEKSKGLFSPDDWACKSCGNINWARRSTCNVCNTAKVNTLGERTGYGGGFMERDEVVEYKRRDDSEDEYDEFGRKKKRYRQSHTDEVDSNEAHETKEASNKDEYANQTQPTEVRKQDGSSEVDDEESGDDADLSKYDIWGQENDTAGSTPTMDKSRQELNTSQKDSSETKRSREGSVSSSSASDSGGSSSSSSSSESSSPDSEDSQPSRSPKKTQSGRRRKLSAKSNSSDSETPSPPRVKRRVATADREQIRSSAKRSDNGRADRHRSRSP